MSRVKLWKGYYLGTGLLSVVGTSFATLSTADAVRILFYIWGFEFGLKVHLQDFQCHVCQRNLSFRYCC